MSCFFPSTQHFSCCQRVGWTWDVLLISGYRFFYADQRQHGKKMTIQTAYERYTNFITLHLQMVHPC